MIESVYVIGRRGRVGSAMSARLVERGLALRDDATGTDLVLLCVPDRAIAEVAAVVEPGPWVAHVSGGTPLEALAPHTRRFSIHPLQTFTHDRGPEQLDGAWAALTGETDDAVRIAGELAARLGLRRFTLRDEQRALYHAGAAIASNYLVTLRRVAGSLLDEVGVPSEALDPLMRRVIDNGFQLTGPIERGDRETVARHRRAIAEHRPELLAAYDTLAALTEESATPITESATPAAGSAAPNTGSGQPAVESAAPVTVTSAPTAESTAPTTVSATPNAARFASDTVSLGRCA